MSLEDRLEQLRGEIARISPSEALARSRAGAVLLDVRETEEIALGLPETAQAVTRGYLEMRIAEVAPDPDQEILLLCAATTRSLLAADDLRQMGYRRVAAVQGGFNRWKDEGLPYVLPETPDRDALQRYKRQLVLPELGSAGQARLGQARVLLIGAGGLGSPSALYLAAAGIGTLGLVDHDRVDRSNLHRQVLHRDDRVGLPKTESARLTLEALNPSINVRTHPVRLDSGNVESIFADYDIVVDGSDNFPTRYLVNDACIRLGLANVYGAVQGFEGQVSVFPAGGRPCYRCLFAEPPPPEHAPSCNEAGVLGVVPGIIGLLQALEVIKLATGIGETLAGRLLLFDGRNTRLREVRLGADPECRYCAPGRKFPGYIDYTHFCADSARENHEHESSPRN
ncbi:molybdopterin-synthase adenylyltransferase MoeB [Wenzhouxiangella limi]|uniref:molybdopterin-synthase adenylyltransferase MoeB n=1 Tax=Wenzhouxiangella limi TaxID=2707351 RepID=UPI0019452048|nr:molybdopterin-synthase adenylyltransferase MoeB [Wenzhouxiangella limi]